MELCLWLCLRKVSNSSKVINLQKENDELYTEMQNLKQSKFNKSTDVRKDPFVLI